MNARSTLLERTRLILICDVAGDILTVGPLLTAHIMGGREATAGSEVTRAHEYQIVFGKFETFVGTH